MKRWSLILAAALAVGGLAPLAAPASASEFHPHYVREPVPGYPPTWWRNEALRQQRRAERADRLRAAQRAARRDVRRTVRLYHAVGRPARPGYHRRR